MVRCVVNVEIAGKESDLLKELTEVVGKITGKTAYTMAIVEKGAIAMGGNPGPAAFCEVRGIGLAVGSHEKLSAGISSMLTAKLNIPADRCYLNFSSVPGNCWGFNGGTF
eukprot:tig00020961_g16658.t1